MPTDEQIQRTKEAIEKRSSAPTMQDIPDGYVFIANGTVKPSDLLWGGDGWTRPYEMPTGATGNEVSDYYFVIRKLKD